VIVVAISVMIESINGKIELVSNQISDHEKVPGISTELHNTNVITRITKLHIIHAIKLHSQFTVISLNVISLGQKDTPGVLISLRIIELVIFVKYV